MSLINAIPTGRPLPLLAVIVCLSPAAAQDFTDADTQEVNAYRLSAASLAKYTQATEGLAQVMAENPPPCGDEEDVESLDGMAAHLDSIPGAAEAMDDAGMSSREYALFTMSLVQSGLGAWVIREGGELPPGMAMENVQFFEQNQAELEELMQHSESMDCEDEYDDEETDWDEED